MRRTMWMSGCAAVLMAVGLLGAPGAQGAEDRQAPARTDAQRAPGTAGMDVWTYNMTGAGTNQNDPDDVNNGGDPQANAPVVNAINAGSRPDVIALQEVCESQYNAMLPTLQAAGYTVHWRAVRSQSRCAAHNPSAPTQLGDLVAVPSVYGPTAYAYDFDPATSAPVGEGLTCLGFTKQSRFTVACSTQISGTDDERTAKTFRMRRDEIEPWANLGYGMVIAGDFNTQPDNEPMKNLYHSNGVLSEGDAQNRPTHENRQPPNAQRKIDYVFFSNNYFPKNTYAVSIEPKKRYSYHFFYAASSGML